MDQDKPKTTECDFPGFYHNIMDITGFCFAFGLLFYYSLCLWEKHKKEMLPNKPIAPLSYSFLSLTTLLFCTEMWQIVDKWQTGYVYMTNLACPCHAITFVLFYAVYIRKTHYRRACFFFNKVMYWFQFTLIAMAVGYLFPESFIPEEANDAQVQDDVPLQQLAHKVEIMKMAVFWSHHFILALVPFWGVMHEQFHIYDPDKIHSYDNRSVISEENRKEQRLLIFFAAIGSGTLLAYMVELPLSLLTGVNVNFMMEPPPLGLLQGVFYRLKVMPLLYLGTFLCRLMTIHFWRLVHTPVIITDDDDKKKKSIKSDANLPHRAKSSMF